MSNYANSPQSSSLPLSSTLVPSSQPLSQPPALKKTGVSSTAKVAAKIIPAAAVMNMQGTINCLTDIIERNMMAPSDLPVVVAPTMISHGLSILRGADGDLPVSQRANLLQILLRSGVSTSCIAYHILRNANGFSMSSLGVWASRVAEGSPGVVQEWFSVRQARFWGLGPSRNGEEPTNWIWKYDLSFLLSYTDADKINRFELQCAAASPAEVWFATLGMAEKASWATFLAAFRTRWPQPPQVTLTVAQKKDQIHALTLKDEDIGVMIEEDRGREWGHIKWARQDFLSDQYTTWADFKTDVAKVSVSQLVWAKQWLTMERKLREDVDKLQNQISSSHKTSTPSPQNTQNPYIAPPAYHYSPHYGTLSTAPPTTNAPTSHIPDSPDTTRSSDPSEPADPDAGKQAYTQQVQDWHNQHGAEAILNSQQPYQLKPGTLPIGSRECFTCGIAMSPPTPVLQMHKCTNTPLPPQETKWREMVSRLVFRALMMAPTADERAVHNTPSISKDIDAHDDQPSPDLSDNSHSLPSTASPSVHTSDFNTSIINLPMITRLVHLESQEPDDDLIVPMLELISLNLVDSSDPMSSIDSDSDFVPISTLPFSDSDFEFISACTSSEEPSSTPSCTSLYEPTLSTEQLDPETPASIELSTSVVDIALSVISTPELIKVPDCYLGTDDCNVIDLHHIADQDDHITKGTPFVTNIALYGPNTTTSRFRANIDNGAMINIIDLKVFKKAANRLKSSHDGSEVPSHRVWTGMFQWNKAKIRTSFKSVQQWRHLIPSPSLMHKGPSQSVISQNYQQPSTPMYHHVTYLYNSQSHQKAKYMIMVLSNATTARKYMIMVLWCTIMNLKTAPSS
ncbi:hypothetical protein DFJ58DRAFT_837953 [Suillus subalutaceus]|uniref:uncharacterized protein n=1 Tax=Suillus subalutaceus TaxID=48586 RepID=UPI001B860F50|nr:uncharacterized protein DFJ58DRAFT_837953 [Suillus subalutaceus]KAG1868311.1 hypothetical protein DFJ58DRAFT_837953 [Suillus subalutaceus]